MPYQSDIKIVDGYVRAEVSGARIPGTEKKDHLDFFSKIRDVIRRAKTKRLLIISKMTGPLSPMVVFDIANEPEKAGWSRDLRIALLPGQKSSREELEMIELVSVNRDMPVRLFDDENDAVAWLKQQRCG